MGYWKWPFENKTYKINFPKHVFIERDVKSITSKEIKNLNSVDILLAGFPCQAFSVAGRKGFKDPRGNLFDEIIRFVEELQKNQRFWY